MIELLLSMAFVAVMFWVFIVRPARRREQQQAAMVAGLAVGQRVMTAGGMFGVVVSQTAGEVSLEVSPGVVVSFADRAIARRMAPAGPALAAPGNPEPPASEPDFSVGDDAPASPNGGEADAADAAPQQPGPSAPPAA